VAPQPQKAILAEWVAPPAGGNLALLSELMGGPALCSRRWIWEQYDHMVMGDTIQRPGGDAAVVRIHGTKKAVAATCDVTPRYVAADPATGTQQAVVEAWRNLVCVGAEPLAITDNLNFASPERPEIMGQIVHSIQGMGEACRALGFPVVSGNVSLYNETNGVGIPPTPAIGAVGVLRDSSRVMDLALKREGNLLVLIGREQGWLGQSLAQRALTGKLEGAPPPVDLGQERETGGFVGKLIGQGQVSAVHDCSDGGLLAAVAEMALAGDIGAELFAYEGHLPQHAIWFGEDQGRYVVEVTPDVAELVVDEAVRLGLASRIVGRTGGGSISIPGETAMDLVELRRRHEAYLPELMG